ncbi:hypothetical protein SDB_03787 [Shigella dysenteriae CDC 74-1112]|nr:hypothetical protein SDB_03787 [Shigella dysenteriae CDC 74-1112]
MLGIASEWRRVLYLHSVATHLLKRVKDDDIDVDANSAAILLCD